MDILNQIPVVGSPILTILAFVVALSVIITVHEYGHYIVGRWSGIHPEVFSLGFGPTLLSRVDKRGTEWRLSAIPLGGYVKFLGDADAASAGKDEGFLDHLVHEEREKELRRSMMGAPLWARAATVAAGPIFNFVFGGLVFAAFYLVVGAAVEPPTIGTMTPLPPGVENPLRPGDRIVAIEGRETPDYDAFYSVLDDVPVQPSVDYTIERDGSQQVVTGPWPFPIVISTVHPNSAASDAGLRIGDAIVSVNGAPLTAFRELQTITKDTGGAPLDLRVWRDGETLDINLTPRLTDLPNNEGGFDQRWLIGLNGGLLFEPATDSTDLGTALKNGALSVYGIMSQSLSALYHVATRSISECALRGAIGIAEAAGDMASQGVGPFIRFIAVLSVAVGLINLFPIPILDGGHLVFHAYEAVTRRPPSERALNLLMTVGLVIVVAFMSFALINDFRCP